MRYLVVLLLLVVMTSCGVPEAPLAQVAPPSPAPVASATVALVPVQATVAPQPSVVQSVEPSAVAMAASGGELPSVIDGPQPGPGEVLLRDAWGASARPANVIQTRYMLYSESTPAQEDGPVPAKTTLWKIDLSDTSQRTRLFDIPFPFYANSLIYGELSPDTTYLTYLQTGAVMDDLAELIVSRLDGSDMHLVAEHISAAGGVQPQFTWSSDSTKIAYIVPEEKGQAFYVYDLQTKASTLLYAHTGGGRLGAWLDNERVLVFLVTEQEKPMQMTALNNTSGAQEILGEFPRWGDVTVAVSPDRTQLLISEYIYEIRTGQFTSLENVQTLGFWSPYGDTIVLSPGRDEVGLHLLPVVEKSGSSVALFSHTDRGKTIIINGFSPDGRYLSVCQGSGNTTSFAQYVFRDLLYDIWQNQWIVLTQGLYAQGVQCGRLIGWL